MLEAPRDNMRDSRGHRLASARVYRTARGGGAAVGAALIIAPTVDPGLERAVESMGLESLVVLLVGLLLFVLVRR